MSDNFHDFFGENFRIAIRFVVLQAPNHPDPENLCGEAFELAWTKTLELRQVPGRAWLYQVLRNKLGDHYRAKRRHLNVSLGHALHLFVEDTGADLRIAVRRCLEQLPVKHREVLVLTYWCDLAGEEAAKALQISSMAFRTRLKRAKQAFEQLYGDTSNMEGGN